MEGELAEARVDPREKRTSRGVFIKRLGQTVLIGLGVAAVPAHAFAGSRSRTSPDSLTYNCCYDNGRCGNRDCSGTAYHFYCEAEGGSCHFCTSGCYTGGCFDQVETGCI